MIQFGSRIPTQAPSGDDFVNTGRSGQPFAPKGFGQHFPTEFQASIQEMARRIPDEVAPPVAAPRQILGSPPELPPGASIPVASPPAEPAGTPTVAEPPAADRQDIVEMVRDAMRKRGLNPDSVKLSVARETVWWPGGTYVNHLITAETADGRKEQFDVGLATRNPWLTAFEIQKYLLEPRPA